MAIHMHFWTTRFLHFTNTILPLNFPHDEWISFQLERERRALKREPNFNLTKHFKSRARSVWMEVPCLMPVWQSSGYRIPPSSYKRECLMDPNTIVRNPSFRLCSLNPLSLFSLFSSVLHRLESVGWHGLIVRIICLEPLCYFRAHFLFFR